MIEKQVLSSTLWTWNVEDLIILTRSNKINEGDNNSEMEKKNLGQHDSLLRKKKQGCHAPS